MIPMIRVQIIRIPGLVHLLFHKAIQYHQFQENHNNQQQYNNHK